MSSPSEFKIKVDGKWLGRADLPTEYALAEKHFPDQPDGFHDRFVLALVNIKTQTLDEYVYKPKDALSQIERLEKAFQSIDDILAKLPPPILNPLCLGFQSNARKGDFVGELGDLQLLMASIHQRLKGWPGSDAAGPNLFEVASRWADDGLKGRKTTDSFTKVMMIEELNALWFNGTANVPPPTFEPYAVPKPWHGYMQDVVGYLGFKVSEEEGKKNSLRSLTRSHREFFAEVQNQDHAMWTNPARKKYFEEKFG